MTSKDYILTQLNQQLPVEKELPILDFQDSSQYDLKKALGSRLDELHVALIEVNDYKEIQIHIDQNFKNSRIISTVLDLSYSKDVNWQNDQPHELENVDLAIIPAHFAVAENGACWVTASQLHHRALPFICQTLAVVIHKDNLVATMHDAYACIADSNYDFGTFIAGPSKTADIEQSLVRGAHGACKMLVYLLG